MRVFEMHISIDAYNYLAFIVYDYLLTNHIYKLRYTKGG